MNALSNATKIITGGLLSTFPMMRDVPMLLRQAVYRRVVYSQAYDFAYFRIPKCANSTVVMTLDSAMAAAQQRAQVSDLTRAGSREAKTRAKEESLAFLLADFRGKRPYAFTVVRNPYSRVLSCYLDKIATPKRKFRDHLRLDDRPLSLIDFLHRLNDGYLRADPHWAPQSELAPFHWLDFVGRVESLSQDLGAVMDKVFHTTALPVVTKTTGQTNSQSKLNEYCGPAERALIARLYARDFEQFYPDAV